VCGGVVLAEGAGEAAEMVTALSGWRSRVGGAHSGQVSEAGFCVEGQHDALSPQRVRGDDEVVSPPGHSTGGRARSAWHGRQRSLRCTQARRQLR